MQSEVPYWIQITQGLAVPAIAALGLGIAFMQWQTAHRKVLLDLFDKRMAAYSQLSASVSAIQNEAEVQMNLIGDFVRAMQQARFLFGNEVLEFLEETRLLIINLRRDQRSIQRPDLPEQRRSDLIEQAALKEEALGAFHSRLTDLVSPYLKIDHRAVSSTIRMQVGIAMRRVKFGYNAARKWISRITSPPVA